MRLLDTVTGKQTVLSQGSRSDRSHYRVHVYDTATDCFTYNANRVTITRPWHMTFAFNPRQAVVINMQKKVKWSDCLKDGGNVGLRTDTAFERALRSQKVESFLSQILSTLLSIVSIKCNTI